MSELTRNDQNQYEPAPVSLEVLVAQIAQSDSMTTEKVEVIERLVALMERREAQQRKERFDEAKRQCQMEMPRVEKNGLIDPNGAKVAYAKLEDLDACIRPIYQAHGFSVSFDAPMSADGSKIRNVARFSCAGHTEALEITAAPSNRNTGRLSMTDAQKVKQTITECRRHLLEMFFSIVTVGADETPEDDPISERQALDINTELTEIKADMPKFYRLFGVEKLADLRVSQLTEVYARIRQVKEKRG